MGEEEGCGASGGSGEIVGAAFFFYFLFRVYFFNSYIFFLL